MTNLELLKLAKIGVDHMLDMCGADDEKRCLLADKQIISDSISSVESDHSRVVEILHNSGGESVC